MSYESLLSALPANLHHLVPGARQAVRPQATPPPPRPPAIPLPRFKSEAERLEEGVAERRRAAEAYQALSIRADASRSPAERAAADAVVRRFEALAGRQA